MTRAGRMGALLLMGGLIPAGSLGQSLQAGESVGPTVPVRAATRAADVVVRTSLSQTALWVGNRVVYSVELACQRDVDIFTDDLSAEKIRLEGLEIVSTGVEADRRASDRVTYRFRYQLTTYRVDVPMLKIGEIPVRYYVKRPGQRLEEAVPAGEVRVAGAVLAFRSTLPDDQEQYPIRDARQWVLRPLVLTLVRPFGVGFILVSLAPVAWWGVALVRRAAQPKARRRSARHDRAEERASLGTLGAAGVTTDAGRRDAYARLDVLLRDHLHRCRGVAAAHSLTPPEIEHELRRRGSRLPGELAASVLRECEIARYAPHDFLPSVEQWRQALHDAESIVTGPSR